MGLIDSKAQRDLIDAANARSLLLEGKLEEEYLLLLGRVRELERRLAELTKENSGHKRVIHILENKVLELKGKPIPMEPRLSLQSNRSNAKEAETDAANVE